MERDRALTLHFIDGTKIAFDFPEQAPRAETRQLIIEDLLKSNHLLVEADGSFLMFPVANIKYIQLTMPPGIAVNEVRLPLHAIRGATIAG
jgi:hypothetical protein